MIKEATLQVGIKKNVHVISSDVLNQVKNKYEMQKLIRNMKLQNAEDNTWTQTRLPMWVSFIFKNLSHMT